MFPHLWHTKQFLDWRFGRQEGEDTESTAAWPVSLRRPRRLRVDSRRQRLASSVKSKYRRPAEQRVSRGRRRRSHSLSDDD